MPPVIRLVQVILFINVHLFAESLSRDIVIYGGIRRQYPLQYKQREWENLWWWFLQIKDLEV